MSIKTICDICKNQIIPKIEMPDSLITTLRYHKSKAFEITISVTNDHDQDICKHCVLHAIVDAHDDRPSSDILG